jgi:hypothetical protein
MDILVILPTAPTYQSKASKSVLAAAELRHQQKLQYWSERKATEKFIPLAVEATGGWHAIAISFFQLLASRIRDQETIVPGLKRSAAKTHFSNLMSSLSVILQKANGLMVAERCF